MYALWLIVSLLVPTFLLAASGDLDPTFGTDGKVITHFRPYVDGISQIAIQKDDRIVAAGRSRPNEDEKFADWALARYKVDGSLDESFSDDGMLIEPIGQSKGRLSNVLITNDNKILVCGWGRKPSQSADLGLARYLPNGTLDASFGNGGITLHSLGQKNDYARGIAILPNDQILISGSTNALSMNKFYDLMFTRFLPNGLPDGTFGPSASQLFATGNSVDTRSMDMGIDSQGRIVSVGKHFTSSKKMMLISRHLSNGALDVEFAKDSPVPGMRQINLGVSAEAWSVHILPNDSILVGGGVHNGQDYNFAVLKLTEDGVLDLDFGQGGMTKPIFGSNDDFVRDIAVDSQNRIVAVGWSTLDNTHENFAVARFLQNGELDLSFANNGGRTIDFGFPFERAYSVQIDSQERIVIGGEMIRNLKGAFAIARLLP